MIRVCLIDSPTVPARFVKKLLEGPGLEVTVGSVDNLCPCDVVVADHELNAGVPTVVYTKQLDLRKEVITASVAGMYQPLHDSINAALESVRQK